MNYRISRLRCNASKKVGQSTLYLQILCLLRANIPRHYTPDKVSCKAEDAPRSVLDIFQLPQICGSRGTRMQADVGRASDLYLLNPVSVTVQKHSQRGSRLFSMSEKVSKTGRTDRRWVYQRAARRWCKGVLRSMQPAPCKITRTAMAGQMAP